MIKLFVMGKMKYIVVLCALLVAGCSQKEISEIPASRNIVLGVDGLAVDNSAKSRAAVDKWDNTTVGIAYVYAPATIYDRALTVNVTDDTGEHINTGMEYPLADTHVSFIGYHPAVAPSTTGDVTYNIQNGDVDVMMSNTLTGKLTGQITDKMVFEHQLARFVFKMKCAYGESYPEPVCGVSVSQSSYASESLKTYVMLDLNTGTPIYKIPGTVFNGSAEGQVVPQEQGTNFEPLTFDLMVQPGVPLDFKVVTLTETKTITISDPTNPLWKAINQTTGGIAGNQYTIELQFSGEGILKQNITVTPWLGNETIKDGGVWW